MYTIPNKADAAYEEQSRIFQSTIADLIDAFAAHGVISGCAVTATTGMGIAIASGTIRSAAGAIVAVTGTTGTHAAAHATLGRFDIVQVTDAGVVSIVTGTAAATPVEPNVTAGRIKLAQVYIPAAATTVVSNLIVDRRVLITYIDPDTALTADSDTRIATQKAIKAFVTAAVAGGGGGSGGSSILEVQVFS